MTFLKEAGPAETTKSASKTRSLESRKRDQKELENIEIFFTHKRHEDHDADKRMKVNQTERPTTELRLKDNISGTRIGSSKARPSSRETSYFSWSSSNQQQHVTEHRARTSEQLEEGPGKQAYDTRRASARERSMTPDAIRQQLIDSGIYRCLARLEPTWSGTEEASPTKLHGKNDVGGKPPHLTEETGSLKAPLSRAEIAQQAYITQPMRAPGSPQKDIILTSKELLTMPEPSLAETMPVSERLSETQDQPISQDRCPELGDIGKPLVLQHVRSADVFPILEDRSATDTLPYVQQHLPGSAMMHSPHEMRTHRHTPRLPVGHFNHRYAVTDFRPISSVSSHYPFDESRWQANTYPTSRSPHQVSTGRGSTLCSDSAYGGIASQHWGNAYLGTSRRQSMLEYIEDLEERTLNADERDIGGGGYSTLRPEDQAMHAEQVQAPTLDLTGQKPSERTIWDQGPGVHYDYETRNPLSPASPYGIPGFEPLLYGQEEQPPVQQMAGPPRPGTSMSGDMMDMAMYWKPNTCGL